ncbi:hypothetical protein GCM10023116_03520 [Kistimonas scapharcae]|uniref:Type I restriction modification DNA specificity domain-containing protein n=1 Tax=Kistimonas scapharcae TaxID=1036133 RepID=A0ABP8UW03_9GAMM
MNLNFDNTKLGEVLDITSSKRVKRADYVKEGIPFFRSKEIIDLHKGNDISTELFISVDQFNQIQRKFGAPVEGDILLTSVGTLGVPYRVQRGDNFYFKDGNLTWFRQFSDRVNSKYLYYWLTSPIAKKKIDEISIGSTQKALTIVALKSLEMALPSIDYQNIVVEILDSISNKIINNRKANQTLEAIAQTLFKSWFVDFDPVKAKLSVLAAGGSAEEAERAAMCAISARDEVSLNTLQTEQPEAYAELARTAALFPSAMQSSAFGEIPHNWEFKKLKDICRVLNGRAYKNTEFKDHGTPIVRIQNLSNGGKTVYSDLDLPKDKLIDKEDFIYAWSATFGPHIWRGPKSIYHYHIWKMDVNEDIVSRYFLYLSMFRKTEQMKNGATGSIFTHLTKSIMEDQDILIATPELNMAFKATMKTYFHKITELRKEVSLLESLRDCLLPKLLSGELT